MTLADRIANCRDGWDVLNLDPSDDGHPCPCFWVDDHEEGVYIHGSCWREKGFCTLKFSGVSPRNQQHIKRLLDELDWYGEWVILP